jgi:hypothetical protein
LLIFTNVASYIGFNKYREINEYSENCKSKSENIQNGTCEIKCNCNCDYGYIGQLCNYKYLNNDDKFYTYKIKELFDYPDEPLLYIYIDDNNQEPNNRLFLEKINSNSDTTTFKYKLTTTKGDRFHKYKETTTNDYEYFNMILPTQTDKEEVLFSKTLLQTSSDNSQQQSKYCLTCKSDNTAIDELLFLCIYDDTNYIDLVLETKIKDYSNASILEISENCFP